jgi:DNA-binding phage protein
MQMKDQPHDDSMASLFREDPALAAATLDAIDQGELLVTLRQMAKAFGGVPAVAKSAELNPTQLYRTLSEKGNPELKSLNALLKSMGLRLSVQPLHETQVSPHPVDVLD